MNEETMRALLERQAEAAEKQNEYLSILCHIHYARTFGQKPQDVNKPGQIGRMIMEADGEDIGVEDAPPRTCSACGMTVHTCGCGHQGRCGCGECPECGSSD